jgi:hypothetical protein
MDISALVYRAYGAGISEVLRVLGASAVLFLICGHPCKSVAGLNKKSPALPRGLKPTAKS